MDIKQLATELVALCNEGKDADAMNRFYADTIVSIEGADSEEMAARIEGIDAVRGKAEWWYANHEVHSLSATGPYLGHAPDEFAVRFQMDITPKQGGDRMQMDEVALYRVADGKIVEERFLYSL